MIEEVEEKDEDLFIADAADKAADAILNEEGVEIPIHTIEFLHDVPLKMIAKIGDRQKTIHDVLALKAGDVIEFSKVVGEPMDVLIGGRLMCRGEIVVVNERYGIRISEVVRTGDNHDDTFRAS